MRTDPQAAPVPKVTEEKRRWHGLVTDAIACLSLANLCFIRAWFSLLFDQDYGYFNKIPITTQTLLALLTNIFLLAGVFWVGARVVTKIKSRLVQIAATLFLLLIVLIPLDFLRSTYLDVYRQTLLLVVHNPLIYVVSFVLLLAIVRWHLTTRRVVKKALLIFAPLCIFSFSRVVLVLTNLEDIKQSTAEPPLASYISQPSSPVRILWVIFDEADEAAMFENRPTGFQMPEFDLFRQQCFQATNAYPPSSFTITSLPSLLSGRLAEDAAPSSPNELMVTWADNHKAEPWSKQQNIFSQVRQMGINTALIGWYHPYGRLFNPSLSSSAWWPYPNLEFARAPSFMGSLVYQDCSLLSVFHPRKLHTKLYNQILAESLTLVTNRNSGLIFVHADIPHNPCIYDPEKGQLVVTSFSMPQGYYDNLRLVDRTLHCWHEAMEKTGLWDKTWVIISSDHGWRQLNMYRGIIHYRIPFMIKAPGTNEPILYPRSFNSIMTHDLVLAIARGEITNQTSLTPWFEKNRVPPPASYPQLHGD